MAPAAPLPHMSPTRSLGAEGARRVTPEVGVVVSEPRPQAAPAPLVQAGVGAAGAEGVLIEAIDAAAADVARQGRAEAPAVRPCVTAHGARAAPTPRLGGLLPPLPAQVGGPLAAAPALRLRLTPRLPLAGVAVRRGVVVTRALLREVGDAETVRQDGGVEARLVATAVAARVAEPRVVVAPPAPQVGGVAPAGPAKQAADGVREAEVVAPACRRPVCAAGPNSRGGSPLFPASGAYVARRIIHARPRNVTPCKEEFSDWLTRHYTHSTHSFHTERRIKKLSSEIRRIGRPPPPAVP